MRVHVCDSKMNRKVTAIACQLMRTEWSSSPSTQGDQIRQMSELAGSPGHQPSASWF